MPFKFNPITHQLNLTSTGGGGTGFVMTLTGDNPAPVGPDGSDNINIIGSGPITVTGVPGSNTLTIGSSFPFLTWQVITSNQTALVSNGYFVNGVSRVEILLPLTSSVGDTFVVSAINSTGWKITQGAGQQIFLGNASSTLGATGYVQSTFIGDSIILTCSVANTTWVAALGYVGNLTVV